MTEGEEILSRANVQSGGRNGERVRWGRAAEAKTANFPGTLRTSWSTSNTPYWASFSPVTDLAFRAADC